MAAALSSTAAMLRRGAGRRLLSAASQLLPPGAPVAAPLAAERAGANARAAPHAAELAEAGMVAAATAAAGLLAGGVGLPLAAACDARPGPEPDAPGTPLSNEHTAQWRIYTDKGAALIAERKLEEGEAYLRRALQEARLGFGDGTPHVAAALNNLAEYLRIRGRMAEAEPMYKQAVAILEASFGLQDPRVANAYQNLVTFLVLTGDIAKAQEAAEKALQIFNQALGKNHPAVGRSMWVLADLLSRRGKVKDSLALRLESVELMEGNGELFLKTSAWRVRRVLDELVLAGRAREADVLLSRYLKAMEEQWEPKSMEVAIFTSIRARLCQAMGRLEEAEAHSRTALGILRGLLLGKGAPIKLREQITTLCTETAAQLAGIQRDQGTAASLQRAIGTAEEAVTMARDMWRRGVTSQPGFSLGSWTFAWGKPKPAGHKHSAYSGSLEKLAAFQLATCLRLLAELRTQAAPGRASLHAAGEAYQEAYLAVKTTAPPKQKDDRKGAFEWPPKDAPVTASATLVADASTYDALLALERRRCVAAVEALLGELSRMQPAADAELLRNLRDILQLEDRTE